MQVAFWSPFHGQTGTTSNTIAAATYIAMNYKLKILLTHSQYTKSNMESAFLLDNEGENMINFDDIGMDSLQRLAKSGQLCPVDFPSYTKTLIQNRLEILPGSVKIKKELYDNIVNTIVSILDCATKTYDLVFVDVNSGRQDKVTNKVLEDSDVVVVNLSQNEKVLKSFFDKSEWHKSFENKKIIVNVGRYDLSSKCSSKYIRSTYKWKGNIYTVPYSCDYMDANNNHDVLNFFYRNNKTTKYNANKIFMDELDILTKRILDLTNISIDNIEETIEQPSFLNQFKAIFKINQNEM